MSSGSQSTYNFNVGDTKVKIENEQLSVNDINYGLLEANSTIHIQDGKVLINNTDRPPLQ